MSNIVLMPNDTKGSVHKLSKLEKILIECEKERKEYLEGWKRAKADSINDKKRQQKLLDSEKNSALCFFVKSVLPVLDSIREGKKTMKDSEGILAVESQFIKTMTSLGVVIIDEENVLFDSYIHEAIGKEEVNSKNKDNTVVKIARIGAKLNDRVIRAAMVCVGVYKDK